MTSGRSVRYKSDHCPLLIEWSDEEGEFFKKIGFNDDDVFCLFWQFV